MAEVKPPRDAHGQVADDVHLHHMYWLDPRRDGEREERAEVPDAYLLTDGAWNPWA